MNKNNKTEKFHVNITPLPNTRYDWDLLNILLNFVVRLILSHRATDVVIECFDLKDPSAKTVAATNATNPDNEAWRDLFTRCELFLFSQCYPNFRQNKIVAHLEAELYKERTRNTYSPAVSPALSRKPSNFSFSPSPPSNPPHNIYPIPVHVSNNVSDLE